MKMTSKDLDIANHVLRLQCQIAVQMEAIEELNQVDDCLKSPSQRYRLQIINQTIRLLEIEIINAQKPVDKQKTDSKISVKKQKCEEPKGWDD